MRHLLLLRHAKAGWDDPTQPDHRRGLDAKGRASGPALRHALSRVGVVPDLVLVSSARRTIETMHLLDPLLEAARIVATDALYLASAGDLFAQIRDARSCDCLMLIGHNPGMHELAWLLAGGSVASTLHAKLQDSLPVGTLCHFTVSPDRPDGARPDLAGMSLRHMLTLGDAGH